MSKRDDPSTTLEGLEHCRLSAHSMVPQLEEQPPIASYAGMRCHCEQGSYTIKYNDGQLVTAADSDTTRKNTGITTVTGIRSTGFTSSAVLARHVVKGMAREQGLELVRDETSVDSRPANRMPGWWGTQRSEAESCPDALHPRSIASDFRPHDDANLMAIRADYGRIICSCEHISEGEILDAIRSPLQPQTLDALKRRTRAMTGRCQSFNCMVPIAKVLARELSIPLHAVTKCGPGTEIAAGPISVDHDPEASKTSQQNAISEPAVVDVDTTALREHYRVVVVGAGPAGVGTTIGLIKRGVSPTDILVVDRACEIGGIPRRYGHSSMASFV
jgi:glycerol-3-phosphate dehydrogenase|eukprot:COSAG02_NODE_680_length_18551_cov_16.648060_8_plen_331_part_00